MTGSSQVVIVGAGPAGCAAGIVLARAGVDVAVIDRGRFPRDKTCGDAVSNLAMDVIDELGAGQAVRRGPHALVESGVAVFPDGTRIGRFYERPGYIVPRFTLDNSLKRALDASGARVLEGQHVGKLVLEGEYVTGVSGRDIAWRAPIVIAADGYGSVGLQAVERKRPRGRLLGVSSTAYYEGLRFPFGPKVAEHFFEHDLPYGYGWIFPAVDGAANVGVFLRQDGYERQGIALSALLSAFIARHAAHFAGAKQVGKVRTWSLPIGPCPGPAAGRGVMLVGDAGGFIDPLSGEGIWQALFTGMSAGRIAAEAVRRGGVLSEALAARYDRECARHIGRHSRAKGAIAAAINALLATRLYRTTPVRAALRFAYQNKSFEITKA